MKELKMFLDKINVNYKPVLYGGFIYVNDFTVDGFFIDVDNEFLYDTILNYLKKRNKKLWYEYRIYTKTFVVMAKPDREKLNFYSDLERKYIDEFWNIFHYQGKEQAEQYYNTALQEAKKNVYIA